MMRNTLLFRLLDNVWVLAGRFGKAAALVGTLVVVPLIAFSESTIKSIVDRWLSQCIIVIAVSQHDAEAPIVRLHTFGEMPPALPLTFAADQGLIDRISLVNHVEQETTNTDPNLLVHPLANQRCPGDLCPDTNVASEKLTVRIKPVSANYVYQLRVLATPPLTGAQLKVYVKPLQDEPMGCRVERATISNFIARQPKQMQLALLFIGLVALTLILGYLRQKSGDEK